jgi:pimeloyl-ACP methyl ester carboxylesterase
MITLLRFLGNCILAAVLVLLTTALLAAAAGVVLSQTWENRGLDYGVVEGLWAWVDSQPIYYQVWGSDDAPTVVLVHDDNVAGLETWRDSAETLAKWGMRVIAVDLRGYGRSVRDVTPNYSLSGQAELLAIVLNQLHIEQATVVGRGWGCAVALQLAAEQPQFVRELVLVAPTVYDLPLPLWQPVAKVPYLDRAAAWAMSAGGPYWLYSQRQELLATTTVARTYWQHIQEPTHVEGTIAAQVAMARSPRSNQVPALLAGVQAPALVLMGEAQKESELQEARRLSAALPAGRLVTIAKAGRQPQLDQATVVNRHISEAALRQP